MTAVTFVFDCLESIIKPEPKEFQTIQENRNSHEATDDALRSQAGIFSDVFVLLDRHTEKTTDFTVSNSAKQQTDTNSLTTALSLAKKGNEGVRDVDPHTCCLCQKVMANRGTLRSHLRAVHQKSAEIFCDLCPKTFFSRNSVYDHMRSNHFEKRYSCDICGYKTYLTSRFKNHKLIHKRVKCPICKKSVTSLEEHMESHKPKASKIENEVYECHCGLTYNHKSALELHQRSHSERLKCEICRRKFSTVPNFQRHWKIWHLETHGVSEIMKRKAFIVINKNGPFTCDKCGSTYLSRSAFNFHNKKFHLDRTPQFMCDLCPRVFREKRMMKDHARRDHLKLLPYICKTCGKSFFRKTGLEKHVLLHRSKTKCRVCRKLVTNIEKHLKSHRKTECSICGGLYAESYLLTHVRNQH